MDERRVLAIVAEITAMRESRDLAERKRLRREDIHGYYGALKYSSLFQTMHMGLRRQDICDPAVKWLERDGEASLGQRVLDTIDRTYTEPSLTTQIARNPSLAIRCPISTRRMWLISDYGIDTKEREAAGLASTPNYALLAAPTV